MIVVCAWCEEETGVKTPGVVSHGICDRHLNLMLAALPVKQAVDSDEAAELCNLFGVKK